MAGVVRVCLRGKLPREGAFRQLRAGKRRFCVSRIEGALEVIDGLCPHKDLPLGKGKLDNGRVVCPWHGWAFDPETGQQHKGRACLRTYPTVEEDGELLVTLS